MIYRPHFTYLAVATPSQVQAREAAANREWRRKLLFAGIPRPPPPRLPSPLPLPVPRPTPVGNAVLNEIRTRGPLAGIPRLPPGINQPPNEWGGHLPPHPPVPLPGVARPLPNSGIWPPGLWPPNEAPGATSPGTVGSNTGPSPPGVYGSNAPAAGPLIRPNPIANMMSSFFNSVNSTFNPVNPTETGGVSGEREMAAIQSIQRGPPTIQDEIEAVKSQLKRQVEARESPDIGGGVSGGGIPAQPPSITPTGGGESEMATIRQRGSPPAQLNNSISGSPTTSSSKGGWNPFGGIGSFFGSLGSAITGAVTSASSAVGNALESVGSVNALGAAGSASGTGESEERVLSQLNRNTTPPPTTSPSGWNPFSGIGSFFSSLGKDITGAVTSASNAVTNAVTSAGNVIGFASAGSAGNAASAAGPEERQLGRTHYITPPPTTSTTQSKSNLGVLGSLFGSHLPTSFFRVLSIAVY